MNRIHSVYLAAGRTGNFWKISVMGDWENFDLQIGWPFSKEASRYRGQVIFMNFVVCIQKCSSEANSKPRCVQIINKC